MGVKIVHCADVHIGASAGIKRISSRRKSEVLNTFLRAVSYAQSQSADLLLVAGDLFDSHNISPEILEEISSAFSKFDGKVFISPGNHDYYGDNTFWEGWSLPDNVVVFKSSSDVCEIPELNVCVYGGAFDWIYRSSHILDNFSPQSDFINIAVIHGDISPQGQYGPITQEEIRNSNMDYIALGHIHKRTEVLKEGNTYYSYSGCLEGQGFDELFEKGLYMGTVDKGKADLEFIPLSRRQFIEETIDISLAESLNDISSFILGKMKEKYGEEYSDWLYKIILTGETSLSFSVSGLSSELENHLYYVKVINKTKTPVKNLEALAEENTLRGIFVRKMLTRAEQGENIDKALKIGLTAFSEEVTFDED